MAKTVTGQAASPAFPRTRWSVVLAATQRSSPESAHALEAICRTYWYPLFAFARRQVSSPEDAQDLTQEFFRLLLEKRWLEDADREKGRLRTFLITALKRFMAKEWRQASAQRRGGGQVHVPFDTVFAESRYAADPAGHFAPDELYDRQWALALLEITLHRLEGEYAAADKANEFAVLKDSLTTTHASVDYGSASQRLGVSAGAARVAVHRLRKRFRQLYREEIAHTLPDGTELEAEMRHLANALARS